jgi:hypothetical protein
LQGNQKGLDEIEGSLGEMSLYHQTHLIYAHCVSPETATMPENWFSRAEEYEITLSSNDKLTVYYPIPADLAISKLCANRDKDRKFVTMLMKNGIVSDKEIEQYIPEIKNVRKKNICKTNLSLCKASVHTT